MCIKKFEQSNGCLIFATDQLLKIDSMRRDVFQAIADPTRRKIIQVIAKQTLPLNSVAETFDISRQAVSKHIKILTECGLIVMRRQGRERYCEAKLKKLNEVAGWVDQYRMHWEQRVDSLELYLDHLQTKNKKNGKRNRHRK
jgi:DNA-binding transcriptional ArsR family regulator